MYVSFIVDGKTFETFKSHLVVKPTLFINRGGFVRLNLRRFGGKCDLPKTICPVGKQNKKTKKQN